MLRVRMLFLSVVLVCVVALPSTAIAETPIGRPADAQQSKIVDTPDLPQAQKRLPAGGRAYCGPVSISNGLVWLAGHGYPRLLSNDLVDGDQLELARVLGSKQFMNTHDRSGTGPSAVIQGIKKYVDEQGYEIARLDYQSWRRSPRSKSDVVQHADAEWAAKSVDGKAIVFLNLGWYARANGDYTRHGGHWVTLVGSEHENNDDVLLIRDPSVRSGKGDLERVTMTRIDDGMLKGSMKGLPLSAVGAWELGGELKIGKRGTANTSVLDAVVVVELK